MIQDTIATFVEAARKGQVTRLDTDTTGHPIRIDIDLAIPSFDFGHINDPQHRDYWGGPLWDSLEREWLTEPAVVRLPFPECAFLFHYTESAAQYESVNLIHARQDDNGTIETQCYFWQPGAPGAMSNWAEAPVAAFTVRNQFRLHTIRGRFSQARMISYKIDAASNGRIVSQGSLLLNRRVDREPVQSRAHDLMNYNRIMASRVAVPRTIRIKVREQREALQHTSREGIGMGGTKAAHERRGYWRQYRSGRRGWVRNCSIHGGSPIPRDYRVE
jgi:hypothetical protein